MDEHAFPPTGFAVACLGYRYTPILCYIKKIEIHHYRDCKAKVVGLFQQAVLAFNDILYAGKRSSKVPALGRIR